MVKQLSIYLKNQPGELAGIMGILTEASLQIMAMCIADTNDNGILRIVVKEPDRGSLLLKEKGITSYLSRVFLLELREDEGLEPVFLLLNQQGMNVEYLYTSSFGGLVIKIEDSQEAEVLLKKAGYRVLEEQDMEKGGI